MACLIGEVKGQLNCDRSAVKVCVFDVWRLWQREVFTSCFSFIYAAVASGRFTL